MHLPLLSNASVWEIKILTNKWQLSWLIEKRKLNQMLTKIQGLGPMARSTVYVSSPVNGSWIPLVKLASWLASWLLLNVSHSGWCFPSMPPTWLILENFCIVMWIMSSNGPTRFTKLMMLKFSCTFLERIQTSSASNQIHFTLETLFRHVSTYLQQGTLSGYMKVEPVKLGTNSLWLQNLGGICISWWRKYFIHN